MKEVFGRRERKKKKKVENTLKNKSEGWMTVKKNAISLAGKYFGLVPKKRSNRNSL